MSTRRSAQALTQGKLTFGATKPTRITSNAKPKQAKTTSARNKKASSRDDITNLDDVHVPSSSSEDESLLKAESSKRAKDAEEPKRAPKARSSAKSIGERAILLPTNIATENLERPTLKERDPKYRKQYAFARGKLNNQRTIHAEGEGMVHTILRCFDMSYEYGPVVGVTRLERWIRAEAMGLNPPKEVKDILMTKEGIEKTEFCQSVLFNEV